MIVAIEFEEIIGVIISESGVSVPVIDCEETCLRKTDDGTMSGGNGRGILEGWVSSIVKEGVGCWTEIAGIETSGEVKE